jgi:hypothetical protein
VDSAVLKKRARENSAGAEQEFLLAEARLAMNRALANRPRILGRRDIGCFQGEIISLFIFR